MRKRNEGYALVLVLVVLVVLCILSSYILTFSLRNLNYQKASASRLQEQYTAAGEIEVAVGYLQEFVKRIPQGVALAAAVDQVNGKVVLTTQGENPISIEVLGTAKLEGDRLNLALVSSSESVQIDCTLRFEALASRIPAEENLYSLTNLTGVEYVSYKISTVEKGGNE